MLGFIAAVQKVVNDLRADYTTARAAKLDNLDAANSTRAPASTALSSATWTGTKAGYLDAAITSRLGSIKAIYAGTISVTSGSSATATITAVNTAKTLCLMAGFVATAQVGSILLATARVELTNSTTVTAYTQQYAETGGTVGATVVGYLVVEFN